MGDDGTGLIGTAIGLAVLGGVVNSVYGRPRYTRTRTVYRNRPTKRRVRRTRRRSTYRGIL